MNKKFYVYRILDTRPNHLNEVIYIGKGKGNRATSHLKHSTNKPLKNKILKMKKEGFIPKIEFVEYFEEEKDAFKLEMELIQFYGRRDLGTGTLCNLTDGGEGNTNCPTRDAAARKTQANPEFQKKRDAQWYKMLEKAPERMIQRHQSNPEYHLKAINALKASHNNPKHNKIRSEFTTKRNLDPEFQAKGIATRRYKHANDLEFAAAHSKRESIKMTNWHTKRKMLEQEIGIPFNERWNPKWGRY